MRLKPFPQKYVMLGKHKKKRVQDGFLPARDFFHDEGQMSLPAPPPFGHLPYCRLLRPSGTSPMRGGIGNEMIILLSELLRLSLPSEPLLPERQPLRLQRLSLHRKSDDGGLPFSSPLVLLQCKWYCNPPVR